MDKLISNEIYGVSAVVKILNCHLGNLAVHCWKLDTVSLSK